MTERPADSNENIAQISTEISDYFKSMLIYYGHSGTYISNFIDRFNILKSDYLVSCDEPNLVFDFYMENLEGSVSSIDSFIGKVLYIDIWASWCGPCRKQFSYANEIKRKMSRRQLKQIEFLQFVLHQNRKPY